MMILSRKFHLLMTASVVMLLLLCSMHVQGYHQAQFSTQRSMMTMKRGQGSSFREVKGLGDASSSSSSNSSGSNNKKQRSWFPVAGAQSMTDLPQQQLQQQQKVQLVDTMLDVLINVQTNPTGAVCVARYQKQLYCFQSTCPSCKIPLTKAKILAPDNQESNSNAPRLSCDFCRATFSLSNGERLATPTEGGGLFSGVMKNIFAAKESGPLSIYALGEGKDGLLLISVD